jgi:hypothetical protein
MDEILFLVRSEVVVAGKLMELRERFLKVPGIIQAKWMRANLRLGGNLSDVVRYLRDKRHVTITVNQLDPRKKQVIVLANRDGRSPAVPTLLSRS